MNVMDTLTADELAALPAYVRISDASRVLGVSATTLRRWCRRGHIKHYWTPSGQRRFSTARLLELRGD